jgi:hypothetical protein
MTVTTISASAAGLRAVEAALSDPAPSAATMMLRETDEQSALADRIASDVLAYLERQTGQKAPALREPSKPTNTGALAAHMHAQACLTAKLRRIADACASLAKIG